MSENDFRYGRASEALRQIAAQSAVARADRSSEQARAFERAMQLAEADANEALVKSAMERRSDAMAARGRGMGASSDRASNAPILPRSNQALSAAGPAAGQGRSGAGPSIMASALPQSFTRHAPVFASQEGMAGMTRAPSAVGSTSHPKCELLHRTSRDIANPPDSGASRSGATASQASTPSSVMTGGGLPQEDTRGLLQTLALISPLIRRQSSGADACVGMAADGVRASPSEDTVGGAESEDEFEAVSAGQPVQNGLASASEGPSVSGQAPTSPANGAIGQASSTLHHRGLSCSTGTGVGAVAGTGPTSVGGAAASEGRPSGGVQGMQGEPTAHPATEAQCSTASAGTEEAAGDLSSEAQPSEPLSPVSCQEALMGDGSLELSSDDHAADRSLSAPSWAELAGWAYNTFTPMVSDEPSSARTLPATPSETQLALDRMSAIPSGDGDPSSWEVALPGLGEGGGALELVVEASEPTRGLSAWQLSIAGVSHDGEGLQQRLKNQGLHVDVHIRTSSEVGSRSS